MLKKILAVSSLLLMFAGCSYCVERSDWTKNFGSSSTIKVSAGVMVLTNALSVYPSSATYNPIITLNGNDGSVTALSFYGAGTGLTNIPAAAINPGALQVGVTAQEAVHAQRAAMLDNEDITLSQSSAADWGAGSGVSADTTTAPGSVIIANANATNDTFYLDSQGLTLTGNDNISVNHTRRMQSSVSSSYYQGITSTCTYQIKISSISVYMKKNAGATTDTAVVQLWSANAPLDGWGPGGDIPVTFTKTVSVSTSMAWVTFNVSTPVVVYVSISTSIPCAYIQISTQSAGDDYSIGLTTGSLYPMVFGDESYANQLYDGSVNPLYGENLLFRAYGEWYRPNANFGYNQIQKANSVLVSTITKNDTLPENRKIGVDHMAGLHALYQSFSSTYTVTITSMSVYMAKGSVTNITPVIYITSDFTNILTTGSATGVITSTTLAWVGLNITPFTLTPGVTYYANIGNTSIDGFVLGTSTGSIYNGRCYVSGYGAPTAGQPGIREISGEAALFRMYGGRNYPSPSASYTSQRLEGTSEWKLWSTIDIDYTQPAGSTISFYGVTSTSSYNLATNASFPLTNGAAIPNQTGPYFALVSSFTSTDPSVIPMLNSFTLHYKGDASIRSSGGTAAYLFITTTCTAGSVYVVGDCSAQTFTDRTPYPKDTKEAYDSVNSMQKAAAGGVDHAKLNPFVRAKSTFKRYNAALKKQEDVTEYGRDLSATVSAQNEVIKDLIKKISALEARALKLEKINTTGGKK
ncbi:exported hypothetical protein [Gammaproteobacteria bacterium]